MTRMALLVVTGLFWLLPAVSFSADEAERVVIVSDGWNLVGDLRIPDSNTAMPAVLMLNQAAGDRKPYENLAEALAHRGIASLLLDLRGHGDSTNLGEFNPPAITEEDRATMIRSADIDVIAAHRYLSGHPGIDADRMAIVGASYSGEEMAEAGRNTVYPKAYVALSPGSFSDESIAAMDPSGVAWLFIVSKNERYLSEIVANVHEKTRTVEIIYLPGDKHATDILEDRTDLAARIASWLSHKLND